MTAIMKRTAVAAALVALATSGLAAGALAVDSNPQHGNITDQDAAINIHKLEAGSLAQDANAANNPAAAGDGISGVPFKVQRLNLDLKKTEDWAKLTGMQVPADACSAAGEPNPAALLKKDGTAAGITAEGDVVSVQTAAGGLAVANVRTGAFLVCEQTSTAATNKDGQSVKVVKKAAPFVVTAPVKAPGENGGWLYDVHVFPKNTVVEAPTKKMEIVPGKEGLGTDAGVKITITGKVNQLAANEYFKFYSIIDPMPAQLNAPKNYTVTVDGQEVPSNLYSTEYNVDDKNMVAVNFNGAGLDFLKGKPNKAISLVFYATMASLPTDGDIENNGFIAADKQDTKVPDGTTPDTPVTPPNTPGGDPDPKDPNTPITKSKNKTKQTWGKIRINKFDKNSAEAKLAGAEFKVYLAATNDDTCSSDVVSGDALTVNGKDVFTTADGTDNTTKGEVTIAGLFIDSASAEEPAEPAPATTRCYVVEEVKAPAGFVLPDANAADAAQNNRWVIKVNAATADGEVVDVPNTQIDPSDIPALPLTGASGQLIMMVVGSALMLGSVGAFFVIRKRQAEKHA